jgi:hypothetical protein
MDNISNSMTAQLSSFGMPANGAVAASSAPAFGGSGVAVRTRLGALVATCDAVRTEARIAVAPILVAPNKHVSWDISAWRPIC